MFCQAAKNNTLLEATNRQAPKIDNWQTLTALKARLTVNAPKGGRKN